MAADSRVQQTSECPSPVGGEGRLLAQLRHTMLSRRSGEPATSERRISTRRRQSALYKAVIRRDWKDSDL